MKTDDALLYRKAADRVWEIAKRYEEEGERSLSIAIKELALQLHDLARKKEEAAKLKNADKGGDKD